MSDVDRGPAGAPFTEAEEEVALLLEAGLTTRRIADLRCRAYATAAHQREAIRAKLGLKQGDDLAAALRRRRGKPT